MELDLLLEQMYQRPKVRDVKLQYDGSKLVYYSNGGVARLAPGETSDDLERWMETSGPLNQRGRFSIVAPPLQQTPKVYGGEVLTKCGNPSCSLCYPYKSRIIADSVDSMKMAIETTYGNTVNAVKYAGPNGKTIMRPPSFFDFVGANIYTGAINAASYDPSNLIGSKMTFSIPKKQTIEGEITMAITREQAEALAAQAAQALQIVNEREEKFGVDDYKNGDIVAADIKWLKRNQCGSDNEFKRQRTYNYAFIKADGYWYSSGPRAGGQRFTWDELVNWLQTRYIVRMNDVTKEKPFIKRDNIVTA